MSSSAEQKTTSYWSTLQKGTLTEASFEYGLKRPTDLDYQLPEDSDFLRGVTFNGPNGPYKCSRQVSRLRSKAVYSLKCSSDISTEEFYPANDRDARYIHMGWPAPSELPTGPMDAMYRGPKSPPTADNLVCRRMVIHRWTISLLAEDLEPVDEFTKAVEKALKESNAIDQHEALRDICAAWGEMIPLCAVIGASMAATGTLGSKQTLTGDSATFRPSDRGPDIMQMIDANLDITGNFERRFESRIQGGSPEIFSKSGFNPWLTNLADFDNCWTWEVVKVNRGVPIIDILPSKLRDQCARLLSQPNAIWRTPAIGAADPLTFNGASLGVKDIKQIDIWYNTALVQDISFVYTDGAVSGPYGFGKTNKISDSFVLARGEFITDVFIWPYGASIPAIQFVKNTTQISPRYGASSGWGEPIISTAGGSALLGLSGSFNTAQLQQLQESGAVWRSDVKSDDYRAIATSSVGYGNGTMFNDYRFLGHPPTSRISAIEFRNTLQAIARFQASGDSTRNGTPIKETTPMRGTDAGNTDTWNLEEDEFITQVSGRYNGTAIYRLEFTTSKGITKRMGQEFGEWFTVLPPKKGMVLYYICGKTVGYIQTLTFVWGAPPLKDTD
ncbi:Jacalin-like lectin domain protein [Rhizoctonia solani]|uniref:Jacalin-like lectin domain protein n=1 Tax=Rhizoctonia solani TaxID=456999 RepID=A0A8H8P4P9_9AGAM|nr:Jacalin-like lectin domain protein [Rhizoctonia solani]QRW23783.1 Jacalin-like lectin domain protein [Rhizoctonia solani]